MGAGRGSAAVSLVTRCPVCATAFRVQRTQLGARGGKVRCGKCGQIFDGVSSLVEEGGEPPLHIEPSPQLGLFDSSRRVSTVEEDAPLPGFMADEEPGRRAMLLWGLLAVLAVAALGAWRLRGRQGPPSRRRRLETRRHAPPLRPRSPAPRLPRS